MTERYLTNQNYSNNITRTILNYSLKERKIPNSNNNMMNHSLFTKGKPQTKTHKVNDLQSSLPISQVQTIQEEDIDYLKLFNLKNKNIDNNQNNRQRKSKFFYSNRIITTKNQNQNPAIKQRAVSTNINQIQQKNNTQYLKYSNAHLSKRATSMEDQKIKQGKYNSVTERGSGAGPKLVDLNIKTFENKEQRFSGNRNTNINNINVNMKKIPIPQNNAYIIHPPVKKVHKKQNEYNNGKEKNKMRNNYYYYDENNLYNNSFNTTQRFYENYNTNIDLNPKIQKETSLSEITNLQNYIIEDKENIIPNHNNSFNYNTINNNNHITKMPINMKLYRNNTNHLNDNTFTNNNQKTKIIPLAKLNEQYIQKVHPNNKGNLSHSKKKIENNIFYTINTENNNINGRRDYLEKNQSMIQLKKPKNQKNLREFVIKKIPQHNNNINSNNKINNINSIEKDIQYNYEEKENINPNQIIQINPIQKNKNQNYQFIENKNETQITNIFDNYNENQLINDLITENLNQNLYIPKEPNKIITKKNSQNINSSKIIKIPIPQKIKNPKENQNQEYLINNPNLNIVLSNTLEQNNNTLIMQNNITNQIKKNNNNHFPNPEKPIRKESKSISKSNSSQNSSNITYNVFNASGWLKNYAVLTHPGCDKNGNQKTNQDSFVFKTNINGINNFNIFGVMDGHGPQGHFVSQFASKYIPFQIMNHREIKNLTNPEEIYQKLKYNEYEIINHIFLETDNQLQKVNFDATESGCTCVLIIHIGSHIICANTGDSRAILISDSLGKNDINDFFELPLSYDYKPEMPEEKQRIEECGGVVEQLKNKNGEGVGPYRVWAKEGGYPGLAMSRSIGDLIGKKLGVIPNPGILEYDLNQNVKYIVVASDGIWEFLSNENVRDCGNKYYLEKNPNAFCHEIVKCAYKIWKENGICVDDITAIAAFF